jgi:HNH endonuclease
MTVPFVYPEAPLVRRHAPQGYADYPSFRPWIRDDFIFRCVYCLQRERWVPGGFHLDHFSPVISRPDLATVYENLVYCCSSCNLRKRDAVVADPSQMLLSSSMTVLSDGTLLGSTPEAVAMIEQLGLNSIHYISYRLVWIRIVKALANQPEALQNVLGYPDDLPDLSRLRPPGGNAKPEGIEQSHFRRRERDELPATY